MKNYLFFCFLIISNCLFAQIGVLIKNIPDKTVNIFQISGEKLLIEDSLHLENERLEYNKTLTNGLYKIVFNKNKWLNFVSDGKEIEIETYYNNILDSLKIIKSESNKLYYKFLKINKDYKTKTELLHLILLNYPKDDEYYEVTQNRLKSLQKNYDDFANVEAQKNQNSYIARYIKYSQLPIIPQNIQPQNQLDYLKKHALDNVDFNDAELISSDVFTNKSIEYLTYYRSPQLSKELLEKGFMRAIDTLLNKAQVNLLVYQQVTEYLIDGFKKFGFDQIIDYIVENYVVKDDLCLDETLENSIEKRIEQSKKLPRGKKVPNIIMPDKDGKVFNLYNSNSEKTLLVFYSIQCPHCQELMPRLKQLQTDNRQIKIIAISLDKKRENWLNFISENKLTFININDQNGWEGNLSSNFYIYATPTMFLLDYDKKIIAKPVTFSELYNLL